MRDLSYQILTLNKDLRESQNGIIRLVKELNLKSSVIYFTPAQRALLNKNNNLHQQLITISESDDSNKLIARQHLSEIARCNHIIDKSIGSLKNGFVKSVYLVASKREGNFICEINYSVPFRSFGTRVSEYKGALNLAKKDLIKFSTEHFLPIDEFIFTEIEEKESRLSSQQLVFN